MNAGKQAGYSSTTISAADLHKSLNLIIIAITFGMAFFTVYSGSPLNGYIRALGVGDLVYSIILALTVFGSFVQIISSYILENSAGRKKMFIISGIFQRLPLIPLGLAALIVPSSMNNLRVWIIICLMIVMSISGAFMNISYTSWVGSLIPQEIRGRFFSKRLRIATISAAITSVASGLLLDNVPGFAGYAILFIIVGILGLADVLCYIWVKYPFYEKPATKIPFAHLLKEPFKNRNYMRYVLFITLWTFSANISVPFFIVYMLENLKMSFLLIMLSNQFITNISTVLFIHLWGGIIDKYGNKPVMKICGLLISLLPAAWLFVTPKTIFLIFIINFFGGIIWPCFDMVNLNLSIWLAPKKNRSIHIAVYSLSISILGVAAAYIAGGAIMQFTGPLLASSPIPFLGGRLLNFHILIFLSFLLRILTVLFFQHIFDEENAKTAASVIRDIKQKVNYNAFKKRFSR